MVDRLNTHRYLLLCGIGALLFIYNNLEGFDTARHGVPVQFGTVSAMGTGLFMFCLGTLLHSLSTSARLREVERRLQLADKDKSNSREG